MSAEREPVPLNIVFSTDAMGVHLVREDGAPMGDEKAKAVLAKLTPYLMAIPQVTARPK